MPLYPVIQNGRYGFIRDDGSIAIPPQYESAMTFTEGLAGIKRDGKWGFINEHGDLIIPARFDNCHPFAHGLALVEDGTYQNYIDRLGKVIITTTFYNCGSFEDDIAPVMPDIWSRGAFIDRTGEIVLSGRSYRISHYSHGLINCGDGGKWGYVNRSGVFEIPPKYAGAYPFHDGLAAVAPRHDTVFCFIDTQGNVAFDGEFQGSDIKFSDGLCAVWDERFGYIDRTGRLIIPYRFEFADHFSEGLAVVKEPDSSHYGYADSSGSIVIEQAFTCADAFEGKIASVIVGDEFESYHYGYIDRKGQYVWKPSR
jgi:WG containing repeat